MGSYRVLILIILEYIYIQKQKNFAPGICVLILIILEYIYIAEYKATNGKSSGLNPYYTGIHLHKVSKANCSKTRLCLNPYYTGIHLHEILPKATLKKLIVLILIILEYIYICHSPVLPDRYAVLILIILEYIYIFSSLRNALGVICLNPYYTGIHLHIKPEVSTKVDDTCLNPYYTGIHLHEKSGFDYLTPTTVLILIILEYIYIRNNQ